MFGWDPEVLLHPETDPRAIDAAITDAIDAEAEHSFADEWQGTVYLVHFAAPIHHAQHYLGWTRLPLQHRLESHRAGKGATLLRVANERGIEWWLVRTWSNRPQRYERLLKNRHEGRRLCPLCSPDAWQLAADEVTQ
jgi:predicted GIY-YIG superfamily endonuclease